jgi:hypothetical protein
MVEISKLNNLSNTTILIISFKKNLTIFHNNLPIKFYPYSHQIQIRDIELVKV